MTQFPRLLDPSMNEVRRITPYDGSISLNIVPLSTASLTVPISEDVRQGSWIEMFTERGSAGIFRVRSGSTEYSDEIITLELDHAVAEIGDYICDEKVNESSTFSAALNKLFGYYKGDRWALSAGSYSDSVIIDINHDNLLEAMLSIMEQHPQYYMAFDFSSLPWRIRIRQRDTIVSAEGRLSRNVTSASVEYDDSELYTRVVVEYGEAGKTNTKTITAHTEANKYGLHEYFMSQSGYTESQAMTAANTFLGKHKQPIIAISISGIDLSAITGESLDTFQLGKLYRLTVPKHGVVVQECITALNWSSLYSNPNNVSISLADVEDPVVKFMKSTQKSGGGTSKKLSNANDRFQTIITETQSYYSRQMHDMQEDLHSEIIQTASEIRTQVWASKSEIYSTIMQTATNIYMHVGNVKSDLHAEIEVTASSIRSEVYSAKSSLYSTIMQTSTNIYIQVGNAKSGLYSRIETTASSIRSEVASSKSALYSTIMQTSTNIYIQVGNAKSGLYSTIQSTASSINLTVSKKVGKDEVISCINQTAESITIQASKINLTGYVKATDLDTNWLSAKIAQIPTLSGISASFSGNVTAVGGITGSGIYYTGGSGTQNLGNAVSLVQVVADGNNYKLQYQKFSETGWKDAGTFSRATTLSGGWSSGKFTVNASPQGNSFWTLLTVGTKTWDGNTCYIPIRATDSDNQSYEYNTGYNATVDITSKVPASGSASGRSGSTYDWTFAIKNSSGTTIKNLTIDCSSIYSDARSGYTQGTFTSVGEVTAIGDPVWFKQHSSTETPTGTWYTYHTSQPTGTYYKRYSAGTTRTLYKKS